MHKTIDFIGGFELHGQMAVHPMAQRNAKKNPIFEGFLEFLEMTVICLAQICLAQFKTSKSLRCRLCHQFMRHAIVFNSVLVSFLFHWKPVEITVAIWSAFGAVVGRCSALLVFAAAM